MRDPIMERLEELTQTLTLVDIKVDIGLEGYVEFDCDGYALSESLKHDKDVSVACTYFRKGTKFPLHNHKHSVEHIIVFKGKLRMVINGRTEIVKEGQCWTVEAGIPHSAYALEDTKIIAICIPSDEGFPE